MHASTEQPIVTTNKNLPVWFWVAAGLGLVWNLVGVAAFVGQITIDPSSLPPAERAFYESTPLWAKIAFFFAVTCGVFGCIALLLRRAVALHVLVLSFLGIVVQVTHSFFISDGMAVFGPSALVLPSLTLTIAAGLIGIVRYGANRDWLARHNGPSKQRISAGLSVRFREKQT